MMKRVIYISIFVSIFGLALSTESILNALITSIFAGYDPSVRPICRGYEQVNVSLDLGLRELIDLNEPQQIIKLKLWIRLLWTDCLLKWNPNDYHNVSNVVVPFKNIWTPDLTLFDSVSTEFWGLDKFRAIISFDGTVQYNFPTVMEVQCQVDVTKFPFDQQTCPLQFGSWIYTGKQLDMNLQSDHADLSELKQNVEWDVTGVPAVKHIKYYACCPDPYIDLTYNLYLKRKPRYYKTNIILPSMIITLLAALGFILPVDSGEKVSLEVTVLLSLTVFQLLIADKLPPSDEARPWIGLY
ncbi:neuronal acetylcholine receptor subunit alpha-10-like [Mytilus californianus]|uniref:neuronal acetylcholine receptor subunit alpha-10-like n=1 Tax=Mytilus californianus TaxID=6549 RepID=UPI0022469132|nr:neuronal acetylcholine receptor subunit alpha-10-like [Mytilus californianus]